MWVHPLDHNLGINRNENNAAKQEKGPCLALVSPREPWAGSMLFRPAGIVSSPLDRVELRDHELADAALRKSMEPAQRAGTGL